jgi:hypothetical protein
LLLFPIFSRRPSSTRLRSSSSSSSRSSSSSQDITGLVWAAAPPFMVELWWWSAYLKKGRNCPDVDTRISQEPALMMRFFVVKAYCHFYIYYKNKICLHDEKVKLISALFFIVTKLLRTAYSWVPFVNHDETAQRSLPPP